MVLVEFPPPPESQALREQENFRMMLTGVGINIQLKKYYGVISIHP